MAVPAKIALATLGSGAVAVSGYEVVSYATGKDGLFISGASKDASASSPQPTNEQQQDTSSPVDKKKKEISDLIAKADFKCTVKVWISNQDQDVNTLSDETDLTNLLAKLKELGTSTCGASATPNKLLVLKKTESNSWSEINETDRVKELAKSWNGKCTIEVRSMSDNSFEYKDVTGDLRSTNIDGLYEKVKDLKTECSNSNPEKTIIFKTENSQWERMTDKDQIEDLIGKDSFKCEIKVKTTTTPGDWKTTITDLKELEKLLTKLKTIKDTECKSSITSKKVLVLLKTGSGAEATFSTEKERVETWKTSKTGTCTLKIRDSSGNRDIKDEDDLNGLIDFLNSEKITTICDSSSVTKPLEVIVQKDNSNWTIYPTVDQVKAVKTKLDEKCTVNIKDNNDQTKEIDNNLKQESLGNLFKQLESAYESHCKDADVSKKPNINIKLTAANGNEWTTIKQEVTG